MDAVTSAELKRLREIKIHIERIAAEFGLVFREQKFDIVSIDKMLEMGAYGFPVNYSFWAFGRDYEIARTRYERNSDHPPFEVVYNFNPVRAYILKTNPVALKITTMAHVYAHNDFYTNNVYFRDTMETMLTFASAARERFLKYEADYGIEAVEKTIEAAHALQYHVDPDLLRKYDDEEDEISEKPTEKLPERDPFRKAFPKKIEPQKTEIPSDGLNLPENDVLYFILKNAPLKPFQKDIISVIWRMSRESSPFWRTQVMNEGWAGYWHRKIMNRLLQEKLIDQEEYTAYLVWDSRVFANHPLRYNPYLVGRAIWQSIEERWDKGQFGEEWERCKDAYEKKHWDKNLGLGRQKIFEVRKRYSDRFFIEHFLNKEIVDDLELYVYEQNKDGDFEPVETDPETIKKILVAMHTNFGIPYMVVDNDPLIREKGVLVLRHIFDELQLDEEYRQKTMEHIFYLWSKTILLKTKLIGKDGPYCVTFSYNPSKGHQKTENCKSGHCRH